MFYIRRDHFTIRCAVTEDNEDDDDEDDDEDDDDEDDAKEEERHLLTKTEAKHVDEVISDHDVGGAALGAAAVAGKTQFVDTNDAEDDDYDDCDDYAEDDDDDDDVRKAPNYNSLDEIYASATQRTEQRRRGLPIEVIQKKAPKTVIMALLARKKMQRNLDQ